MKRVDKRQYYLNIAEVVASRSTCLKKRYGAVIVKNDRIVATGYNGSPHGERNCCDVGVCYCSEHALPVDAEAAKHGSQYGSCVAVHAEQNALLSAGYSSLYGATLYLTGLDAAGNIIDAKPCNICNRMIKNAGILAVIASRAKEEAE